MPPNSKPIPLDTGQRAEFANSEKLEFAGSLERCRINRLNIEAATSGIGSYFCSSAISCNLAHVERMMMELFGHCEQVRRREKRFEVVNTYSHYSAFGSKGTEVKVMTEDKE